MVTYTLHNQHDDISSNSKTLPQTEFVMEQNNQLKINLSPEVAEGKYANLAIIGHSASEFILDFACVMPGTQAANVQSRLVMTPDHAKRLLAALQDNIQKYEAQFGPIKMQNAPAANGGVPLSFGGGEA